MSKILKLCVLIGFLFSSLVLANIENSFLLGNEDFKKISDVNRESESWGTCTATFLIVSQIMADTPSTAKQYKESSNGARLAVIMSHVADGIEGEDLDVQRFNALWRYSQSLGESIPETKMTAIQASGESLIAQGKSEVFFSKIKNTLDICISNLEYQQVYIDMWRELAKSGLLQFL